MNITTASAILQGYIAAGWRNKADLRDDCRLNRIVMVFPQPGAFCDLRLRPAQLTIGQQVIVANAREMASRFAKIKRISETEWSVL